MSKFKVKTNSWQTIFTDKTPPIAKPKPVSSTKQYIVDFLLAENGYIEKCILEFHQMIDSKTTIEVGIVPSQDADACWNRLNNKITLKSKSLPRAVILHEAIHPLCVEAFDDEFTAYIISLAAQHSIHMEPSSRTQYGDMSVHEFVCEFLSNDKYANEIAQRADCRVVKAWIALKREELLDKLKTKLLEQM